MTRSEVGGWLGLKAYLIRAPTLRVANGIATLGAMVCEIVGINHRELAAHGDRRAALPRCGKRSGIGRRSLSERLRRGRRIERDNCCETREGAYDTTAGESIEHRPSSVVEGG